MTTKKSDPDAFDVAAHLTTVGTNPYLTVRWRIVWLRTVHPEATITSDLVEHSPGQFAVFRSEVIIPGSGSAVAYGSETYDDFRDYLEKAETKALGRSLAALGYGAEHSADYDDAAPAERPAGEYQSSRSYTSGQQRQQATGAPAGGTPFPASPKQRKYLMDLTSYDDYQLDLIWKHKYGRPWADATSAEVSPLIEAAKAGVELDVPDPDHEPAQHAATAPEKAANASSTLIKGQGATTPKTKAGEPIAKGVTVSELRQSRDWQPGQIAHIDSMLAAKTLEDLQPIMDRLDDLKDKGHKGAIMLWDVAKIRESELGGPLVPHNPLLPDPDEADALQAEMDTIPF